MQAEWWRNFFSGLALETWLSAMTEEATRAEVDFLEKVLEVAPKGKVLDVPCGQGRHSIELAAREYQVTGVDFAAGFLDVARAQAAKRQVPVTWVERDMRELAWSREFDGAFCLGGSFGYFEDADNARFLASVARALKPGGRFLLDAGRVAENILPRFREREWGPVGDILFLEENRYDHVRGRMETEYTMVRNGQVEKKSSSDRIYNFREHLHLLREAGFENIKDFASYSLEPFQLGSQALYLVGTRAR